MEALDGNAIAGPLLEYFGSEMTTALGTCAHCGTRAQIGKLVVPARAPGTVVRCRHCANVVMVLVPIRRELRVDTSAFRMEQAEARPRARRGKREPR
ncbi:MAG TPA: DUF6510 family protein [Solirubrobacteraceae bacterium]|nr:DUF6510 family protein [Solirubrobacteraceae bacterium]